MFIIMANKITTTTTTIKELSLGNHCSGVAVKLCQFTLSASHAVVITSFSFHRNMFLRNKFASRDCYNCHVKEFGLTGNIFIECFWAHLNVRFILA